MAYLVLARKYRPQTFDEIVGQGHVTRTLANAFSQDRVHHAFLFCGPRGVGKTTAARVLAKALNCEKGPTAKPDGTCSACQTITAGTAVDYFEMDGASNRGIDSIRELTDAVRYQPAVLRKKVYVIDEVHMLTTEAFNALLKTLEEPPPHVTFVMATTEPHKVPNTILSRCQRFDFKLVPSAALTAHLADIFSREAITIEPGAISLLARESGGSVRDALSLADQVISYVGDETITETRVADVLGVADRSLTRKLVANLTAGDVRQALLEVDAASARGVDELQIARAIARHLRDLAVIQKADNLEGLIDASTDETEALRGEAADIEPSRLRQIFDRMMRACDDLGESQQPRLILDFALIDCAAQEPVLPLGDLIARLGDLETRLIGGGGQRGSGGGGKQRPAPRAPTPSRGGEPTRRAQPSQPSQPSQASQPSQPQPSQPSQSSQSPASPAPTVSAGTSVPEPVLANGTPPAAKARDERQRPPNGAANGQSPASFKAAGSEADAALPPIPPPDSPPPPLPGPRPPAIMPSNPDGDSALAAASSQEASPSAAPAPTDVPQPAGSTVNRETFQMLAAWERIIVALEESRQLGLAGLYQNAKVLSFSDEKVEVGFEAGSMTAEVAIEADKVAAMTSFLAEQRGHQVGFSVRLLSGEELAQSPNAKSILEASRDAKAAESKRREHEAKRHPITQVVLDTFGAQIKEIKTDV